MRFLVTGGTGLLGSEFRNLRDDIIVVGSKESDLTKRDDARDLFSMAKSQGVNHVIHCAAKVGGLHANMKNPVEFFEINNEINTSVVRLCHEYDMGLTAILSSCIYPDKDYVRYPLTEDQLHNGPPHTSNFAYAYAKRMLGVQCNAYRDQFGSKFISVIPNNLYGLNDSYSLEDSHVIPALIRKFFEAKARNEKSVEIWGTGNPRREFTFARDAAKIILWLSENYTGHHPVNIGNTDQISIRDLAATIGDSVGFKGEILFNSEKPDGQFEKPTSNDLLRKIGWEGFYTDLKSGIDQTVKFFENQYPNLRGV